MILVLSLLSMFAPFATDTYLAGFPAIAASLGSNSGEKLADSGFTIAGEGLHLIWDPDEENKQKCRDYGRQFVRSL